jgi:hypothetical protein
VAPAADDLLLLAPQPGTSYQTQCKAVTVSALSGAGLIIPDKEVVFGTGVGVSSSPLFEFDGASVLLSNDAAPAIVYDVGVVTKNQTMAFIPNNEANLGGFGWTVHRYPPNAGNTRYDCVMQFGFNPPQSGSYQPLDHAFNFTLENEFKTNGGVRQIEFYMEYAPVGGGTSLRPFAITVNLVTDVMVPGFNCQSVVFDDETGVNTPWLQIQSNDGDPSQIPYINIADKAGKKGELRVSHNNINWLRQQGISLIGYNSAIGYLLPDGNLDTLRVFNTPGSTHDFNIEFGSTDFIKFGWTFSDGTMTLVDSAAAVKFWKAKYKSSDGSMGDTGSFTSGDVVPKTVTVKDGIITSIV